MRRPPVFELMIAVLALVGVAVAVVAATEGSVALVLTGAAFVVLSGVTYLGDRRSRAARLSLERRIERGFEAARQNLTEIASHQELAEVTERLDRIDVRVDAAQRRLVASIDAARMEAAERAAGVVG